MAETEILPCPSCGKTIPAGSAVCPLCTASLRTRMSLHWVTGGILLLLVIACVHFITALVYTPRLTNIDEITAKHNFEKVRVLGRVTNVRILRGVYDSQSVQLEVRDASDAPGAASAQTILVKLEGDPAKDYLKLERPFRQGDVVEVAASVFAGEGFRHLSVSSPRFITLKQEGGDLPPPAAKPASQVTVNGLLARPDAFRNRIVHVADATVVDVSTGFPFFIISDPGETNTLVVFGDEGRKAVAGGRVSVRGQFVFYEKKQYWEIKLRKWDKEAVVVCPGPVRKN